MKKRETKSRVKYLVIGGYVLLVFIMLTGLWAIYKNLVDFSEKRIRSEDRQELIIVSNIINQLYEAENSYDLLTFDSAEKYIDAFNEVRPSISLRIDTLKQLSVDSTRISQLDSLDVLLEKKEENLLAVLVLMDSLRKAPPILKQSINTYVPKRLNSNIENYLKDNILEEEHDNVSAIDTTVVVGEKKGLFKRLGDAFAGKQDSTVILQNRPTKIIQKDYKLFIDTIVNMVRYSERVDLENQRKFQIALSNRQASMNITNQILTTNVDALLKNIEKEEIEKSIYLVEAKESTLTRSYNTIFWVSLIAFFIALIFGLLFITDINRSQRYKKRLEKSNYHINKLLQSREKLMLSISHDIKSPIGSVLGYIELIESNSNEASHDTYLLNMKKSSEHILQLVTNLLDYQRIESNTWTRKEMSFSVRELLDNTISSFEPLANQKSLKLLTKSNVPYNLISYGDPFMIRDIYSNIISNAIKYTFEGEIIVTVDFDSNKMNNLHLSVKDTGVGISKENHSLVFEEFEQIGPDSFDSYSKGSGLGLAITKGLVEQLNGKIDFVSEKGVGTEFFVELPISVSKADDVNRNGGNPLDSLSLMLDGVSVLLVDDDPIQLTMAAGMLRTQKVKVTVESNPNRVLNILTENTFDMIFLDIQMPELNGFNLIKQILDSGLVKRKSSKIIALTATSNLEIKDYKDAGFTDFLNKPYTSHQLFDVIVRNINITPEDFSHNADLNPKGVEALISYVRDDRDSTLAILHAFVDECSTLNNFLNDSDIKSDSNNSSNLAHKMLPLFKMMGDRYLTSNLLELEKKGQLGEKDLKQTIDRVDFYIEQATKVISTIQ